MASELFRYIYGSRVGIETLFEDIMKDLKGRPWGNFLSKFGKLREIMCKCHKEELE